MAPRRPSALDNPPSSDSDSEDISDSHLPDNPSDSEAQSSDKEERESSDNNDDDVSPSASDFTVKPSLSLPKLPAAVAASVADVADAAIKKGKSPIVRIWTYEAELAALKAMHDYISNKGLDPFADFGAFYEFAKKFIPGEMTRIQVKDKLRRLKEKYFKIANKGQQPLFSKPLEAKSFEISKKIWGRGAVAPESSAKRKGKGVEDHSVAEEKSNKRAKKEKPIVVENGVVGEGSNVNQVGFWEKYPRLKEAIDMENNGIFVKEGKRAMELDLTKMGDAEANELEDEWKLYQVKEAELRLFRSELVTKQTRIVLGWIGSNAKLKEEKKCCIGQGKDFVSNMCHQCQRNDKGRVVRSSKCGTKRYCVPCLTRWYPNMTTTEENFADKCPFCCHSCNCKSCLRLETQSCIKLQWISCHLKMSSNESVDKRNFEGFP